MRTKRLTAFILSGICMYLPVCTYAQAPVVPLGITVVEGADQIVNPSRTADILVRVTAAGATVTFKLPAGAGVSFPGGGTQMSITSDLQGFARSERMSGTGKGGKFDVEVEAVYMGQTAVAVVHESNGTPVEASKAASSKKGHTILWIAIIGAVAGGVAVAAMKSKSSGDSTSSSSTNGSVTIGTPTVGAPQ